MYCQNCGKQIPEDSKCCPMCGLKLSTTDWRNGAKIFGCIFCLLAALFFVIAGCCGAEFASQASYSLKDPSTPLKLIVVSLTWMSFGFASAFVAAFCGLLVGFFKGKK